MTISATKATFDDAMMWVHLTDGRVMGVPLAWFPKLAGASFEELSAVEVSPFGLHWDGLDEDISVVALVEGKGAAEAA